MTPADDLDAKMVASETPTPADKTATRNTVVTAIGAQITNGVVTFAQPAPLGYEERRMDANEIASHLAKGEKFLTVLNPMRTKGPISAKDIQFDKNWRNLSQQDRKLKDLCPCNLDGHECPWGAKCKYNRVCTENDEPSKGCLRMVVNKVGNLVECHKDAIHMWKSCVAYRNYAKREQGDTSMTIAMCECCDLACSSHDYSARRMQKAREHKAHHEWGVRAAQGPRDPNKHVSKN